MDSIVPTLEYHDNRSADFQSARGTRRSASGAPQYADRGERESRGARGEATSRSDGRELSNRGRSSCRCCGVFSWLKNPSYGRRASHICRSAQLCDFEKDWGSKRKSRKMRTDAME